jgi:hypothetical protein
VWFLSIRRVVFKISINFLKQIVAKLLSDETADTDKGGRKTNHSEGFLLDPGEWIRLVGGRLWRPYVGSQ